MKYILTLLLYIFCCSLTVQSQNQKLDSLYIKLAAANTKKEKINLNNNIAIEVRTINADTAIAFAERALVLAEKENFQFGIGTSYLCLAFANISKSRYQIAKEFAEKALTVSQKINSDSIKAYAMLSIGSTYFNRADYDKAIENSLSALILFDKNGDATGTTKTKVALSQIYQVKGDIKKAEALLQETLVLFPQIKDTKSKINTLHTLANVYGMEEKYAEALQLDSIGLVLCETENAGFLKSSLYDNMANCYTFSGRYEEAKKYFFLCLAIDSSFGNKKQMSDTYLNLGNLMLMQKKYALAEAYLYQGNALADSTGYKHGQYGIYILLSDLYKATNENDKALTALKTAYSIKDKMINESTEGKIAELETIYQTEKKEQQLKLQKAEISKKNFMLWGLIGAVLLLVFSGLAFYRKRQIQNKLNLQSEVMKQQDIATKAIISAEENERKRIAAELHDGVGQMMSVAKMNLSAFENEIPFRNEEQKMAYERLINLVDESCKEIRSVSHQMMPNALLKSGLASAVKEFLDKIDNRIIKISLHTEGLQERLDSNTETVLYRVIQECVNNVIKHSDANNLDISLIKDTDGISATIEDNGRGFDVTDKQKFEGIGLKNINSRVSFLKGTVDFDSSPGKGTLVAVHVPIL